MDTKTTPIIMRALLFTVLLVAFAATAFAQTTTGTVSMSARRSGRQSAGRLDQSR